MERQQVLDLIGLLSLILIPAGLIEVIHPYIRYPSLIIGIVIVILYMKSNYDLKIIRMKQEIKKSKQENSTYITNLKNRVLKLESWKEAAESFWYNKKGEIDPFILIIMIIIMVAFVLLIQKFG